MGVLSSGGSIIPDVLAFPTAWTTVRKGQLRLSNPYRQLVRTYQEPQSHANRNMSRSSGRHRHPRSHQAEAIAVPFRLSARNRITSHQRVDTMTPSSHRAASLTGEPLRMEGARRRRVRVRVKRLLTGLTGAKCPGSRWSSIWSGTAVLLTHLTSCACHD